MNDITKQINQTKEILIHIFRFSYSIYAREKKANAKDSMNKR